MEWTRISANWDQYESHAQDRWGRLTSDDLIAARGGRNELIGCVLKRYKIERGLAERHVDDWINSFG
jgi:uncharacterized protein YjbJ (UPF0337 family)